MTRKKTYNSVVRNMKAIGTYDKAYIDSINIYVDMLYQLNLLQNQFYNEGSIVYEDYTNKAGATNNRKTPLYLAIEQLRKDIVIYNDRLMLNPKAVKKIEDTVPEKMNTEDIAIYLENFLK